MKKIFIFCILFLHISVIAAKNKYNIPCFTSLKLYSFYEEGRSGRFPLRQFILLEEAGTETINLSSEEINMFNHILCNAKLSKGFIAKAACNHLYLVGNTESDSVRLVLITPRTLYDANRNVFFEIKDEECVMWLKKFQNRFFGQ